MSAGAGTRVGWGFDAHRLDGEPPLRLGGVTVSEDVGVTATSDGDVVAHAVSDALLGACVLGDIGEHYPSDDPAYRDADSMAMLVDVVAMAARSGWRPTHLDVTVIAETVRVGPHRSNLARNLANALGLDVQAVSVKATSADGLGFTGRGEGLAAVAVVSVTPMADDER